MSSQFLAADDAANIEVETGIHRQILAHGPQLMLCRVSFAQGARGSRHQHPHTQATYVESGRFRVSMGERWCELGAGDSFHVAPGEEHESQCLEAGVLIDTFTPMRADFLPVGAQS